MYITAGFANCIKVVYEKYYKKIEKYIEDTLLHALDIFIIRWQNVRII